VVDLCKSNYVNRIESNHKRTQLHDRTGEKGIPYYPDTEKSVVYTSREGIEICPDSRIGSIYGRVNSYI
jgi:hypothetical protein